MIKMFKNCKVKKIISHPFATGLKITENSVFWINEKTKAARIKIVNWT